MLKYISLILCSALLGGCLTLSGNYHVFAVDDKGKEISGGMALYAQGSGIYTVRNSLCSLYPEATIRIMNMDTGKDATGESPYKCKNRLFK